jgi:hypothetical protein
MSLFLAKSKLTWRRSRGTKKYEEEEKVEEWLQEKTLRASLKSRKASHVFFCNEGVQVRNFVEKTH